MNSITIGLTGSKEVTATPDMSAVAMQSGTVANTFASPAMLALMEGAAVNAIDHLLPEGFVSVGIDAHIQHIAPSAIYNRIRAEATVTHVEGRKITFKVNAWDEKEEIGTGTHTRYAVRRHKFDARILQKQQS
ncbi:MAG: thioesterase family protein [Ardenticatenaceae bacterium]